MNFSQVIYLKTTVISHKYFIKKFGFALFINYAFPVQSYGKKTTQKMQY